VADRERAASESQLPHHQARKAQIDAAKAAKAAKASRAKPADPQESLGGIEKLGTAHRVESYKLQKAKAEMANIELDKLAGTLVERAEVERVLIDFGLTLNRILLSMPQRIAAAVAQHGGDVAAVQTELETAAAESLEQIASHMQRKMETMN
jgi:phage terminase Nu1 subunit (DNA packaging protein)